MARVAVFCAGALAVLGSTYCGRFSAADEAPGPAGDEAGAADARPSEAASGDAAPPKPTCPAGSFSETFSDDSYLTNWSVHDPSSASIVDDFGDRVLQVNAPVTPRWLGRALVIGPNDRIVARGRMRLVQSATGEVDIFRLAIRAPDVAGMDTVAIAIVRRDQSDWVVESASANDDVHYPLSGETLSSWTAVTLDVDLAAGSYSAFVGNQTVMNKKVPAGFKSSPLSLQIGAPFNDEAAEWVSQFDDICVTVTSPP